MTYPLFMLGRWEEVMEASEDVPQERIDSGAVVLSLLTAALEIYLERGELEKARRLFSMFSRLKDSTDVQERSCYLAAVSALRRGEGRLHEALEAGTGAMEVGKTLGASFQTHKQALIHALEAALTLSEREQALELLATIDRTAPGRRSRYLEAHAHRFRGRLNGDVAGLEAAAARFRELGNPFWLAVALLEHAEATGDGTSLSEAREIFERLKARPWLERVTAAGAHELQVPA